MASKAGIINRNNNNAAYSGNEWVEIVEPKSKQRIYANLETGLCAKNAPVGAVVRKSEEFSDLWWELYDQKTGKYYYYNSDQQKTAWTRPVESTSMNASSRGKLLIIPVSKLQTFKKVSNEDKEKEKCDASTQTVASNLVSTGTQTISEAEVIHEFNDKLKLIDATDNSSVKSSSCTHSTRSDSNNSNHSKTNQLNHRQHSDFTSSNHVAYLRNQHNQSIELNQQEPIVRMDKQTSRLKSTLSTKEDNDPLGEGYMSYFGPPSSYKSRAETLSHQPSSLQSSEHYQYTSNRSDKDSGSTSTFGQQPSGSSKSSTGSRIENQHQRVTTNNLSHYLVREAREMGIALISDDEIDDDDHETDDDCVLDDDEDTDMRSDLNASQDFGENSSEGWKSFSDQESPGGKDTGSAIPSSNNSPILCETTTSFTYNHLIDDEKDRAASLIQQLDHRKLVENFKKSRQSSSFGLHDSLGRSYKLSENHTVQKIKNVADSYFHHQDKEQVSDKLLRQLSTLSTLPRPHKETKDKIALTKPEGNNQPETDADYDVVEENCAYYSDSEQVQANSRVELNAKIASSKLISNLSGEPQTPNSHFDRNKSSRGSTFSVESFARENLTRHPKKGGLLFNRKVKWSRMITWTKNPIRRPMISSVNSDLNADSIASFKLIQQYMGDRKVNLTKKYRQILAQVGASEDQLKAKSLGRPSLINAGTTSSNHTNNASASKDTSTSTLPDRLRDELAYELASKGCAKTALRDEIYVQLARQLTENPSQDSVSWGLILVSIMLNYFSPSNKFSPFLLSFLETHAHPMARDVCLPRLDKRLRQSWLSYCRKPADGKEISIVRLSITKWPQYCGVFGESLERIMELQSCSPYLKSLRLPWILTTLGEKLIETGGMETEGIFRCAADHDLLAQLRLEIDCVDFRKITDAKQVHSLLSNVQDPHVIAGLLKLFFRQLYEPVFPPNIYETCLQSGHDGHMACRVFNEKLPNLNKDVIAYLIGLLQSLAKPEQVALTKMDNSNLSMVWAPNLLRMPEQQQEVLALNESRTSSKWSISAANGANNTTVNNSNSTVDNSSDQQHQPTSSVTVGRSQSMIFEQTRQEMQFIRSLIVHLDTSFIGDVV